MDNQENKTTETNVEGEGAFVSSSSLDSEFEERKLLKLKQKLEEKKRKESAIRFVAGFYLLVGLVSLVLYKKNIVRFSDVELLILLLIIGVGVFLLFIPVAYSSIPRIKLEIEYLEKQKNTSGKALLADSVPSYFDSLVKINVRYLEEYYELVKISNSHSFQVSLVMSIFGIFLIITGCVAVFVYNLDKQMSYLVGGAGLVIQVISGLLFYLYNKTIIQLKDYHQNLLQVQNVLLSFKLIDDFKDESNKSTNMGKMIEYLLNNQKAGQQK